MRNLYPVDVIEERYGLSRYQALKHIREGHFGQPIKPGRYVFVTDEGIEYFESCQWKASGVKQKAARRSRAARVSPL